VAVLLSYPCLCVGDVARATDRWCELLDLTVTADAGWYVELGSLAEPERIVLALCRDDHPTVAAAGHGPHDGMLVSVVVDDVDAVAARVPASGGLLVHGCQDEGFGQRHLLLRDADRFLVDVIQRTRPSAAFLRVLAASRRARR
jgi:catechol 2,3-dioxygenase-like lactoylglutathione lyase family enzyme